MQTRPIGTFFGAHCIDFMTDLDFGYQLGLVSCHLRLLFCSVLIFGDNFCFLLSIVSLRLLWTTLFPSNKIEKQI
jgi:hypothetical protein